ncbi:hypothetical protein [Bacillus sp. JCM 19034]|uniref:hypothetical protein n=1 Tax=Bacillus sp. JCM 19034 TaxID=1481928 RepID=UPI0007848B05|nr:hypothetical protein [Bacillus sp. JCM 19034]
MKKHTNVGKVIYWLGFVLFILGFAFNDMIGMITNGPEIFSNLSIPAFIGGIVLLICSNFFTKKLDKHA